MKGNWNAGFNISMIQDYCVKLIYLKTRQLNILNLRITHIQGSIHIVFLHKGDFCFFFFFTFFGVFSNLQQSVSPRTSILVLVYVYQSFSYFFSSSCAYALSSEESKLQYSRSLLTFSSSRCATWQSAVHDNRQEVTVGLTKAVDGKAAGGGKVTKSAQKAQKVKCTPATSA